MKLGYLLMFTLLNLLVACGGESKGASQPSPSEKSLLIADTDFGDTCDEEPFPSYEGVSDFSLGPVNVKFYSEDDFFEDLPRGHGTNGTDPNISRDYIGETTRNYISYERLAEPFLKNHSIHEKKINIVWEGEIIVESDSANILAGFDFEYGDDVVFTLNSTLRKRMSCQMGVPIQLSKGVHTYKIEWHSHSYSEAFNSSFIDYKILTKESIYNVISPSLSGSEEVAYGFIQTPETFNDVITVTPPTVSNDLILVLDSNEATNWILNNPENVNIKYVLLSSHSPVSTFEGIDRDKIIYVDDISGGLDVAPDILLMTGMSMGYHKTSYNRSLDITTEDSPDYYLIFGHSETILSNLQETSATTSIFESSTTGQEVATRMVLNSTAVLDDLTWTFWMSTETRHDRIGEDFIFKIYTGDLLPEVEVESISMSVEGNKYYDTEGGTVYRTNFDFNPKIDSNLELPAGNYWVSIQHVSNGASSGIIMEQGGLGIGGAFNSTGMWSSTIAGSPATNGLGASIEIDAFLLD